MTIYIRKEGNVFYLTTQSTHFILGLYGVGHMVKDHLDSERKPAAGTWVTLSDKQQGFFYIHHPTDRIAHTMAFDNQLWNNGWNEK